MDQLKDLKRQAEQVLRSGEFGRYRTLLRRIGSGVIDGGLILIPAMLFMVVEKWGGFPGRLLLLSVFVWALSVVYNVVCVGRYGTTIGKKLMGMRIVVYGSEEAPLGWRRAFLRELLNTVNVVYALFLIILYASQGRLDESTGYMSYSFREPFMAVWNILELVIELSEEVTALFSAKRRAVHDLIAGTVVVKEPLRRGWAAAAAIVAGVVLYFAYLYVYGRLK